MVIFPIEYVFSWALQMQQIGKPNQLFFSP